MSRSLVLAAALLASVAPPSPAGAAEKRAFAVADLYRV
jgi:hypothetical protein